VLNVEMARDPDAEKHLCPMPLNITKRALQLWSNEGDVVFSPFGGIGSEGVACIARGRRFIGTELHPIYWKQGVTNLKSARPDMDDLFGAAA
jgi:DNA modification methylase